MTAAPPEAPVKRLKLKRASEVHATKTHFLEKGLIPIGTSTIFAGASGIGKTTILLSYMAKITRGECDGLYAGKPQNVIVLSPEDDEGAITRPRLEAAGADLDRVHFMAATRTTETGDVDTYVAFPTDIPLLIEAVKQTSAVAVMLDPIASLIEGNLDKREDVRAAFDRLGAEVAKEYQLALVMVAHNKKGMDSVRGKISGSAAITDAARSVLAVAKNPDDGTVVLSVDKSSYSTAEGTNLAFTLTSVDVPLRRGGVTTVAKAECIGVSEISVAQLNARAPEADGEKDERNPAQRFLVQYLSEQPGGEAPVRHVYGAGSQAGFTQKELQNARSRCRQPQILSEKAPNSFDGGWLWKLDYIPEELTKNSKDSASQIMSSSSPSVSSSQKRDNVVQMFQTAAEPEMPTLDGFELSIPEAAADRLCVVCDTSLAGRRIDTKTCSPTCRKKLSDQKKEIS